MTQHEVGCPPLPNNVFHEALIILAEDEYDESADMVMTPELRQIVRAIRAMIGRGKTRLEQRQRHIEQEEIRARSSYSNELGGILRRADEVESELKKMIDADEKKWKWLNTEYPMIAESVTAYCRKHVREAGDSRSRLSILRGDNEHKKRKFEKYTEDIDKIFGGFQDHLDGMNKQVLAVAKKIQEEQPRY